MKILLVQPHEKEKRQGSQRLFNRLWQPLDLANIAGLLDAIGVSVRILDNRVERLRPPELEKAAKGYDIVFVASAAYDRWQCPPLHAGGFLETVKSFDRDRCVILGPQVTLKPGPFLMETGVKAAVTGEPESAVVELVTKWNSGDSLDGITGVAILRDGRLVTAGKRDGAELSGISKPAFHLLPMERYGYSLMEKPFSVMEGSRGCPFHCKFCNKAMYTEGYRRKDPRQLAEETARLNRDFGVKSVYYLDLEFALDRGFAEDFCREMIKRNTGVTWCCQTRAADLDDTLLGLMAKAGCTLIHMGVESGSPDILRNTGKGLKLDQCLKAVSAAKKKNIRTALFFNYGFPGETESHRSETLDTAIKIDPDYASFHMLIPYPGTRFAEEQKISSGDFPVDAIPSYFHTCHDEKTLRKWVLKSYLKFYLRPWKIIRMITGDGRMIHEKCALFLKSVTDV
jgi:radical SAM superfamily enzyme YgiQ (UPF0313 family)